MTPLVSEHYLDSGQRRPRGRNGLKFREGIRVHWKLGPHINQSGAIMSSDVPVVHQGRWSGYLPFVILYVAILIPLAARNVWHPEILAFGVVLSLRLILRNAVGWSHRRGISLVKNERWADAVPCFERSYEFFTKHRWVDRWRALTMLSASKMEYRELALVNLAFCHAQLGESAVARTYYRLALTEYPRNKMAQVALRLMGANREDACPPVPADARLASLLDRRG